MCPVRIYHVFPHYLINSTSLWEKLSNEKCVLNSSATFSETFLNLRRIQRDIIINVHRTVWSTVILVRILMKREFTGHISTKFSNIKFYENLCIGNRVVPCGRTDGQIDLTMLIAAFRNFVNAPKSRIVIFINTMSTKADARELKIGCMYVSWHIP